MSNHITNKMILLAGYPATGKSYLCQMILKRHPNFETINLDEIKEKKYDEQGFDNLEEKASLEYEAWRQYYIMLEKTMKEHQLIISDYPFSDKQKPNLEKLGIQLSYDFLTIRLVGDMDVICKRSKERDLDSSRHLGHLVSRYHKGDVLLNREKADCLADALTLKKRCSDRAYNQFQLGQLIEVDVTDFSAVNYEGLLQKIDEFLL